MRRIDAEETMPDEDNIVRELISEMMALMSEFPKALERRAAEIQTLGKDPELAVKLAKGADAMRDSGNIYLTWARHYAAMSEGNTDATDEDDDETDDFDV